MLRGQGEIIAPVFLIKYVELLKVGKEKALYPVVESFLSRYIYFMKASLYNNLFISALFQGFPSNNRYSSRFFLY